ncbi:MAG TPA: 16S rRNA (cytosine(1402)-N(4))-methyltransferase RsmH [Anaerohalosphaeraceae bacterium]|nr:16S rRNA (cytosine(1402)-N(4))-methyltransferase RsmH [Anaerohalosphaeraceae bacterium]
MGIEMMHNDWANATEEHSPGHIPVLCKELAERIRLPRDGRVVDATIGYGGHSRLFGAQLGPEGMILGLDVDPKCIKRAQSFTNDLPCKVVLVRENFAKLPEVMKEHGIQQADFIMADLGICSAQIEDTERGLSFQADMPLDMRLDEHLSITAADLVNQLDETALADLIYRYGEERASRKIAHCIVQARQRQRITTTGQLALIIQKAVSRPERRGLRRLHPATRTFQALRIAVNRELECLEELLEAAPNLLKTGGFLAIISFHSLEDRLVKNNFRKNKMNGIYHILTPKPITAGAEERRANPRSRSAKLRIAQRI